MEGMGLNQLVKELKKLNPEVSFDAYDLDKASVATIFGTAPAESLVYPEGYYFSQKNGITDKHNTQSGLYEYFDYVCDPAHFERSAKPVKKTSFSTFWSRWFK